MRKLTGKKIVIQLDQMVSGYNYTSTKIVFLIVPEECNSSAAKRRTCKRVCGETKQSQFYQNFRVFVAPSRN